MEIAIAKQTQEHTLSSSDSELLCAHRTSGC